MLKEKMVTRSFTVSEITCLCVDVTTATTVEQYFKVAGSFSDSDKALQAVKKVNETDTFKIVAVLNVYETEKLYGIPEKDFMNWAVELNPETRKPW